MKQLIKFIYNTILIIIFIIIIGSSLGVALYPLIFNFSPLPPLSGKIIVFFDDNIRVSAFFFLLELLVIIAGGGLWIKIRNNSLASKAHKKLIKKLFLNRAYPAILNYARDLQIIHSANEAGAGSKFKIKFLRQSVRFIEDEIFSYEREGGRPPRKLNKTFNRLSEALNDVGDIICNAPKKEDIKEYNDMLNRLKKNTDSMKSHLTTILENIAPGKYKDFLKDMAKD